LVEYAEKNGINKEIRRKDRNQRQVANNWLTAGPRRAGFEPLIAHGVACA
jgi:hypothetical protein